MPQQQTAPLRQLDLLNIEDLSSRLQAGENRIALFREALQHANSELDRLYQENEDIALLVSSRARMIDQLLALAWRQFPWPDEKNISLVAVGGYGRGELHPHSDIDLLILTRNDRIAKYKTCISGFLTLLWDISLEIGQSVRSLKQCKQEAKADITVATALMESRTLAGPAELRDEMEKLTSSRKIWPIKAFLQAKWDEQIARHEKYQDID
jgi:[protein-PII] uridylyltransferase